jgi:plasmid stabilization system protein ParE
VQIEWSSAAVADLQAIADWIGQDRGRYGRLENTRELIVSRSPNFVVYQIYEERLLVLNVVHGAQRWP